MVFFKGLVTLFGLFLWIIVLPGCESNAPQVKPTPVDQTPVTNTPQTPLEFIAQANQASSPEKERLLLQAVALFLTPDQNNQVAATALKSADAVLDEINVSRLPDELKSDFYLLSVRQALLSQQASIARLRLQQAGFERFDMSLEQQIELGFLRYEVLVAEQRFLAAAKELLFVKPLLSEDRVSMLNSMLWETLMALEFSQLNDAKLQTQDQELTGWLMLGAIAKNFQGSLTDQFNQYVNWRNQFVDHPANNDVPPDIQLLSSLSRRQVTRIGMMLPLSGNLATVGQAIKDGFLAAYYDALRQGQLLPELMFYDTQRQESLLSLYEQAQSDQVELMIGPLDKDKVRELEQLDNLPIVTLALNYGDVGAVLPEGLYEFGLAIEDEAQQVASRAFADNFNTAAILVADGSSGDRALQSFAETFEDLGGRIANIATFTNQTDYSATLKAFLSLDASERRAGYIKDILGQEVNFQLRRRQDIDMIFLFATPEQARSIKQTLNFLFAQTIPVYATSHVYSGSNNAQLNRDINNIFFVDIPWRLTDSDGLKQTIERYRTNDAASLDRLYAFGADTFRIFNRLPQLELRTTAKLFGATGALSLKPNRQILRELMWAQIKNGRAFPLPVVISKETVDY